MAKTKISEFSSTAGNNTDIDSINIAEGCAPSGINNAIRELMAQLKDFQTGAAGDSFNGPVGTTTAAAGAFTTLTASSTATLNTLASSGATLTGGTINGTTIGGTTAAAVSATTLTTSSTVTLNGGTANSVCFLNGSKVLTTGSALTFDGSTFGVKGSGQIAAIESTGDYSSSGSGFIRFKDSTGNRGYIGFGGTSNLMTVSNTVASAALNFELAGTERMRLTSTGLGIGTSSPKTKLNVIGDAAIGSTNAAMMEVTSSGIPYFSIAADASNYRSTRLNVISSGGYADLSFERVGTTARTGLPSAGTPDTASPLLYLDASAGNVGIGTSSPNASAILDAQSTTKGVRMPNMTTTQKNAIASPPAGLMVFDTTLAKLCVYSGAAWETITSI